MPAITKDDIKAALMDSGIMNRPDWHMFVVTKDWGRSVAVRTGDNQGKWLIQQYYDTDEDGQMTTYHGEIVANRMAMERAIKEMLAYAATVEPKL